MNIKDIYKSWAPDNKLWVDWVRPVPFIELKNKKTITEQLDFNLPIIRYIDESIKNTAIILDIDGCDAIKEGIALIKYGFRPIPIFNGTIPQKNSIGNAINSSIEPYLVWGANILNNSKISENSLPAFLLDTNRLNRNKIERGIFDSSWDIYPQDIPTPDYLLNHNINKIIIRADKLHDDLEKVLYKFYKKNILIYITNGLEEPKLIKIKKPKKIEL